MEPIVDDPEKMDSLLLNLKKRPGDFGKLRKLMLKYGDLVNGCHYPETDVDVAIAAVLRWLHDEIFQTILYGVAPQVVELISFIESAMQTSVEPKRGMERRL